MWHSFYPFFCFIVFRDLENDLDLSDSDDGGNGGNLSNVSGISGDRKKQPSYTEP